jgi:hypothetical protein
VWRSAPDPRRSQVEMRVGGGRFKRTGTYPRCCARDQARSDGDNHLRPKPFQRSSSTLSWRNCGGASVRLPWGPIPMGASPGQPRAHTVA